jgi:hypothetical protein
MFNPTAVPSFCFRGAVVARYQVGLPKSVKLDRK